jgi:hypothetical protein
MIDPTTHCPRCNIPYLHAAYNAEAYLHHACSQCYFKCFIDPATRRKYTLSLVDKGVWYTMIWLEPVGQYTWRTTKVDVFSREPKHKTLVGGMSSNQITFDYWLPLDITLDTLKLYLTFS